jgi:hypothetical protein
MRLQFQRRERAVALVVTLIMLSVVTVMAVVFLGISRRERSTVGVTGALTQARLAADAGMARAQAEVLARIAATDNLSDQEYFVSTNFISRVGFRPGISSVTNVSYVYADGQPIRGDDLLQNLTNLFLDPRPPVFITTNRAQQLRDFRYYLDLNRNAVFDTNGWTEVWNRGVVAGTNWLWGDPEWIGILERPDWPHSGTNRFVARTAYVVLPAGKSLDVNFAHNRSKPLGNLPRPYEAYNRNQGVGSWELNLAAFLRTWLPEPSFYGPLEYGHVPELLAQNSGRAFGDAAGLVEFRHREGPRSMSQIWGGQPVRLAQLRTNLVDFYARDVYLGGVAPDPLLRDVTRPWPGADNFGGYATISDFFDRTKTRSVSPPDAFGGVSLAERLFRAGSDLGTTSNRYAFYRLISQLGTESVPAGRGRIHLTYTNGFWDTTDSSGNRDLDDTGRWNLAGTLTNGRPALVREAETNLVPWTATRRTRQDFFMLSADSILRQQFPREFPRGLAGGIPVYPTNWYSGAVHRCFQLAANLLDANLIPERVVGVSNGVEVVQAPSVFRPIYKPIVENGIRIIHIVGYEEVEDTQPLFQRPWRDLTNPAEAAALQPGDNAYGVPWVIGVRKHWPNLNELYSENTVLVTRRLQATRNPATRAVTYNQSYEIGVTNVFGLEMWNAYTQTLSAPITLRFTNVATLWLRDSNRTDSVITPPRTLVLSTNRTLDAWAGRSFEVATNGVSFVPRASYLPGVSGTPLLTNTAGVLFDPTSGFAVPDLRLNITNRMLLVATAPVGGVDRIVDLVTLNPLVSGFDVSQFMTGVTNLYGSTNALDPGRFWLTNRVMSSLLAMTAGITNQIFVSTNDLSDSSLWANWSEDAVSGQQRQRSIDEFRVFLGLPPLYDPRRTNTPVLRIQVPFSPTRKLLQRLSWQANDPLVHYHFDDLYSAQYASLTNVVPVLPSGSDEGYTPGLPNLNEVNRRMDPWGGQAGSQLSGQKFAYNPAVKDPGVTQADDWEFPSGALPHVGWMGRIHRGTPWQTIYLKSGMETLPNWLEYAGQSPGNAYNHPTNDWRLLDGFTSALTENATRGLLGVNQTNAAAWAAVFGGVRVRTNTVSSLNPAQTASYDRLYIQPETWQFQRLLEGIHTNRLTRPGLSYRYLGEILSAPVLTDASPFLNLAGLGSGQARINDAVYEAIPQQVLGLLKSDDPFFVVYSYGQALRPADRSLVLRQGAYFNLCTNYQVTSEVLTKATFRIDRRLALDGTNVLYNAVIDSFNVLPVD